MPITNTDTNPEFENINTPAVPESPHVTHEQYVEMATINFRVRELKQLGFDLREHLDRLQSELTRCEESLANAREELIEKTKDMQSCFEKYIYEPFNITGEISISDTEPHIISTGESNPRN